MGKTLPGKGGFLRRIVASAGLSRCCAQKCPSCGELPGERGWNFTPCPHCSSMLGDVAGTLLQGNVLPLRQYLLHPAPVVKLIGMILAMAIRDGVDEIRFVGRKEFGPSECPWDTARRSWQVFMILKEHAYEMVPPPELLGAQVFLYFKEVCRMSTIDANRQGRLQISIESLSQSAELAIEELEDAQVARISFVDRHPDAPDIMRPYLVAISMRAGMCDEVDRMQEPTG